MTESEFIDLVSVDALDGSGYWGTETHYSKNHGCFGKKPEWATCIHWFNK